MKILLTLLDILLPVALYIFIINVSLPTWQSLLIIFCIILAYNLLRKYFYGYYAFDHPDSDDDVPPASK